MITWFLDRLSQFLLSRKRIDHNPMYICIMVWDLIAGTFAVSIGLPDSAMTRMTPYSTTLICGLMFWGGLTTVWGIVIGTRLDLWRWVRKAVGKSTKVDQRIPYLFGLTGTPALMVSYYYYSIAIMTQMPWETTQFSEASLALFVAIGCSINFFRFGLEIRNINRKLPALISREIEMQLSKAASNESN